MKELSSMSDTCSPKTTELSNFVNWGLTVPPFLLPLSPLPPSLPSTFLPSLSPYLHLRLPSPLPFIRISIHTHTYRYILTYAFLPLSLLYIIPLFPIPPFVYLLPLPSSFFLPSCRRGFLAWFSARSGSADRFISAFARLNSWESLMPLISSGFDTV